MASRIADLLMAQVLEYLGGCALELCVSRALAIISVFSAGRKLVAVIA